MPTIDQHLPEKLIIDAKFPEKLAFLFRAAPYKVARGGRSGAKSWGFARALLILAIQKKLRILCAREVQKSIKDSVHKLLSDQITMMGLDSKFQILRDEIRGKNGAEIFFSGLSDHTVTSIKSFEGVDIVWVEEGQAVSKRSWDILLPTIRKENSEIWVSYNPELETDATHQLFTVNPPDGTINVEINWRDNPWHNDLQEAKRLHCLKTDPDNYPNIWEGKCKPAVEGAIYFKEIQQVEAQGRIRELPYDPMLKVHVVLDLGWEDSLATGLVQKVQSEIRIIEYVELNQTTWALWSAEMKTRPYNWGKVYLPHDGYNKTLNAHGKSSEQILTKLGWKVVPKEEITQLSIEDGIRATRLRFPQMYFSKPKTAASEPPQSKIEGVHHTDLSWRLIECLKRCRRHINQQTQSVMSQVKDKYLHGADMLRYTAINSDHMTNEDDAPFVPDPTTTYEPFDAMIGI